MDIMQKLYDSEINCDVSSFWDAGLAWRLGDAKNGFVAGGVAMTWRDAELSLASAACEISLKSRFARENSIQRMTHL